VFDVVYTLQIMMICRLF